LCFLVGAGALVAWLILAAGPIVAALAAAVSIIGVLAVSWFAYTSAGLLLDPVYPALALAALYVSGSLGTYARTELERARVRAAFGHYVSPVVVDELARRPEKLVLGGELRDVTLLFADVRQFSQIAERLDASELIDFVNALFGPLSDVILDHRGTIDKYMGDGVMAFWNAPLDQSDHAADACRAALDMLRALEAFNGRGAVQAAAKGQPFQPVRIGIGVNTGQCAAGNFGSAQRFDYSVLGDAVNVAARLESLSKTYGAAIVCGQRTVEAASDLAFLEIDRVVLRGRSQAEQIYALIGDDVVARSPAFSRLALAHGRVLKAMANRDTAGAHAALEEARSLGIRPYMPLADYLIMRLEAGGAAPVGDG
jgi:adenylate cyclase